MNMWNVSLQHRRNKFMKHLHNTLNPRSIKCFSKLFSFFCGMIGSINQFYYFSENVSPIAVTQWVEVEDFRWALFTTHLFVLQRVNTSIRFLIWPTFNLFHKLTLPHFLLQINIILFWTQLHMLKIIKF